MSSTTTTSATMPTSSTTTPITEPTSSTTISTATTVPTSSEVLSTQTTAPFSANTTATETTTALASYKTTSTQTTMVPTSLKTKSTQTITTPTSSKIISTKTTTPTSSKIIYTKTMTPTSSITISGQPSSAPLSSKVIFTSSSTARSSSIPQVTRPSSIAVSYKPPVDASSSTESPAGTIPTSIIPVSVSMTSVSVEVVGDISGETVTVRDHVLQLLRLPNASSLTVLTQLIKISDRESVTNMTIVIRSKYPSVSEAELTKTFHKVLTSQQFKQYERPIPSDSPSAITKSWVGNHVSLVVMIAVVVTVLLLIIIIGSVYIHKRQAIRNTKTSYIDEGTSLDMSSDTEEKIKVFENPVYADLDC